MSDREAAEEAGLPPRVVIQLSPSQLLIYVLAAAQALMFAGLCGWAFQARDTIQHMGTEQSVTRTYVIQLRERLIEAGWRDLPEPPRDW